MSYSSSWVAGLIKVERDNSLSRSPELPTLVIPWEIVYVFWIKFVSLPVLHAFTFLLLLLWPYESFFLSFACPLLNTTHFFSLFFSLWPHTPYLFLSFKSLLVSVFTSLLQYLAFLPLLSLSPSLSSSLYSCCTVCPSRAGNLPIGPVSPSIAQLAGLIDQWSSWIPQKVNY